MRTSLINCIQRANYFDWLDWLGVPPQPRLMKKRCVNSCKSEEKNEKQVCGEVVRNILRTHLRERSNSIKQG